MYELRHQISEASLKSRDTLIRMVSYSISPETVEVYYAQRTVAQRLLEASDYL